MANLGKNSNGVPFNSRVVREDEPLILFYDARFPHTKWGQFVSSYYYRTLAQNGGVGINLDGGVDDWFVDAHQVDLALAEV